MTDNGDLKAFAATNRGTARSLNPADTEFHAIPRLRRANRLRTIHASLAGTDAHPLISSSVFHYEFEFIHPFSDGNGRIGRLWQILILSQWNPLFARLPVETVIRDRQADYYRVLSDGGRAGNSTAFIEFLLDSLLTALRETHATDQVGDQLTDQVKALLLTLAKAGVPLSTALPMSHSGRRSPLTWC